MASANIIARNGRNARQEAQHQATRRRLIMAATSVLAAKGFAGTVVADVLAEARVSIFAISTHDTDYLLVKDEDVERAGVALRRAGHQVP